MPTTIVFQTNIFSSSCDWFKLPSCVYLSFLMPKFQIFHSHGFCLAIWLLPSTHYWNCTLAAHKWLPDQYIILSPHSSWHLFLTVIFPSWNSPPLFWDTAVPCFSSSKNCSSFHYIHGFFLQHSKIRCFPRLCPLFLASPSLIIFPVYPYVSNTTFMWRIPKVIFSSLLWTPNLYFQMPTGHGYLRAPLTSQTHVQTYQLLHKIHVSDFLFFCFLLNMFSVSQD